MIYGKEQYDRRRAYEKEYPAVHLYSHSRRYVECPLFSYRNHRARPYACMLSIGKDCKADKAFTGNELGE